jgi:hypothetical protein
VPLQTWVVILNALEALTCRVRSLSRPLAATGFGMTALGMDAGYCTLTVTVPLLRPYWLVA